CFAFYSISIFNSPAYGIQSTVGTGIFVTVHSDNLSSGINFDKSLYSHFFHTSPSGRVSLLLYNV
ncbi:MAG: hypothetical protein SPK65_01605, partial [Succinivibrio dextrinosolvens]|nr:hypothetical protein [Succinivibrio dextrinosolvens]